jgi:hypothetical protein
VLFEWPSFSHIDDVEALVLKVVRNISHWLIGGKVMDFCLDRLFTICGKGKIVEITFLQVGFYG